MNPAVCLPQRSGDERDRVLGHGDRVYRGTRVRVGCGANRSRESVSPRRTVEASLSAKAEPFSLQHEDRGRLRRSLDDELARVSGYELN